MSEDINEFWKVLVEIVDETFKLLNKYANLYSSSDSDEARVGLLLKFAFELKSIGNKLKKAQITYDS